MATKGRWLAWMSGLVGAWTLRAWRAGRYDVALARLRRWSFQGSRRRTTLEAFLLTAAGRGQEAMEVLRGAGARPCLDLCDPSYDLDFARGRALVAELRLEEAQECLTRLQQRYPGSAAARLALGDLLLWQGGDALEAQRLLDGALSGPDAAALPYWKRMGLEAELRASHAWAMGCLGRPAELLHSLDLAVTLAGRCAPVQGAVYLRLGFAFAVQGRLGRAQSYWRRAAKADPRGWAGKAAAAQLERTATRLARRPPAALIKSADRP